MKIDYIKSSIEAMLFVWGEPLESREIARALGISNNEIRLIIKSMMEDYEKENRGIFIKKIGNAYQLQTKKEHFEILSKLVDKVDSRRLSNSAMETLSIIAYKQPITRIEIEKIRGVKCTSPIETLISRELIEEVGRLEQIGRPILYGTTSEFLRVFNIENINDLPGYEDIDNYFKADEEIKVGIEDEVK
ncbi:MAG: SMC-Scp complex subunit ScpB [Tissierellia bacterium]|nr:SMC-Scp complex subunit ScpB [Tissierellia bacterium]